MSLTNDPTMTGGLEYDIEELRRDLEMAHLEICQLRGALDQQYKQAYYAKAFMDLHYKFEEELKERIRDLEKKNMDLVKERIRYEPNR